LSSETDKDGDGLPDDVWYLEYEDGNLIEESWDQDGDGVVDQRWMAELTADEWGYARLEKVAWDKDGDGLIDESIMQQWNDSGNLAYQSWDKDEDGTEDERINYLYDENEYQLVEVVRMRGDTKLASLRWNYQFDEYDWNYYILSIEADENGDGNAETLVAYQYDGWIETEYGNSWTEMRESWFTGNDTTASKIITTTYDRDSDYSVKVATDADADGYDDEFCLSYSVWDTGEASLECDTDGDQQVDWKAMRSDTMNCKTWYDDRFDDWIRTASDLTQLPTSPELAKERAYLPRISQVFEKARVVGTVQSLKECYDCFWY